MLLALVDLAVVVVVESVAGLGYAQRQLQQK